MAWRKKSSKKNVPIVQMSEEEVDAIDEKVTDLVKSQLPLVRVKRICKMHPDVEMLNAEALQLMTKSAELFIKELSDAANQNAAMEKRKTIQPKDIDKAIKKMWEFAFLEDALDGWPKMLPKKRKPGANASQEDTAMEETILEETEEHDEEHDDVAETEETEEAGDVNHEEEEDELPETVPEEDDEFVEKDDQSSMKDPFAEQF